MINRGARNVTSPHITAKFVELDLNAIIFNIYGGLKVNFFNSGKRFRFEPGLKVSKQALIL